MLRKYVTSTTTVDFPDAAASSYKLQLTDDPDRVEDNLKQEQDFFRAMGALVREMKYGDPHHIVSRGSLEGPIVYPFLGAVTNSATQFGMMVSSQHPDFYDGLNTSLIGADFRIYIWSIVGSNSNCN